MIGVVLLAHDQLRRTAQLARFLAGQGCKVVVHIDRKLRDPEVERMMRIMGEGPNLAFARRRSCEWGTVSLVDAALDSLRLIFERWPGVTHVCQISGACLPIKPIAALEAHLAAHPDVDFIESVDVEQDPWVVDGLSLERFTLYHPFAWRRHRGLFDLNVTLQRRLGIRRAMPEGLQPRMGSQWWCLSRRTLDAILSDPRLPEYLRFFRMSWIPDESFFQTLAAKHSDRISGQPLTFVRFDPQGKPYTFYDDHLELLMQAEGFFARKIWRGANRLYEVFLDPGLAELLPDSPGGGRLTARFERAQRLHAVGRKGLINQGRHPGRKLEHQHETARPYLVVDGLQKLCPGYPAVLNQGGRAVAHGELFHPDRVEFAGDAPVFTGNLSASVAIRDHKPVHFLSKLIWIEPDRTQCFVHAFSRGSAIDGFLIGDPNAHVLRLQEGWMFDLFNAWQDNPSHLAEAASVSMAREAELLAAFAGNRCRARVLHVGLEEVLRSGAESAGRIARDLPPALVPLADFSAPTLPDRFAEFALALARDTQPGAVPPGLIDLVTQVESMARILRRKA